MHKPGFKYIIGLIVLIGVGVIAFLLVNMYRSNDYGYNTITRYWHKNHVFADYSGDLGIETAKDLHYYVDAPLKQVIIGYGYVKLTYTFDQLDSADVSKKLDYIGITYEKNKAGDNYRFYWMGDKIEPWAKRPN